MIASVQPFGVGSLGGGARILRALFADAPVEVVCVCTSLKPPPETTVAREVHVPARPRAGRLESTRVRPYLDLLSRVRTRGFTSRLSAAVAPADAVHVVVHDRTFAAAVEAACEVGVPFFLSVHDDIEYADPVWARRERARATLARAWHEAAGRFAVSPELGEEYCRRLGRESYSIVTDGLATVPDRPLPPGDGGRVYFMGLVHLSYEPNFLALLDALELVDHASLFCRSGSLPTTPLRERVTGAVIPVTVAPFVSDSAAQADFEHMDLLYLPLPFDERHESLVRLSLPTKLISYLGSGRPIVYHGPPYGNAYELLSTANAGFCVTSLDPHALARALSSPASARSEVAANALGLARRSFLLEFQRRTFWDAVGLNGKAPS